MDAESAENQCNLAATEAFNSPEATIWSRNTVSYTSYVNKPISPNYAHWVDPKAAISHMYSRETIERTIKEHGEYMDFCARKIFGVESISTSFTRDVEHFLTINPINYLVLASCSLCMKHTMVAQDVKACPHCGGSLLLFEEETCFGKKQ